MRGEGSAADVVMAERARLHEEENEYDDEDEEEEGEESPNERGSLSDVRRSASRFSGFDTSAQPPDREELLRRGVSLREVDATMVRWHQNEVLMHSFQNWILSLGVFSFVALLALVGLLAWHITVSLKHSNVHCADSLELWNLVSFVLSLFNLLGSASLVNNVPRRDFRIGVWFVVVPTMAVLCNFIALSFMHTEPNGIYLECKDLAEVASTRVLAMYNLFYSFFVCLNFIGLANVLRMLLDRGLLRTQGAAPEGALDHNTDVLEFGDPILVDNFQCPICLENFDKRKTALRTKACGHFFHQTCLQRWSNINHTCPVCRHDLTCFVIAVSGI